MLLERSADRIELGADRRTQPIHDRNDRERNAGCDQTVFDRGCPRLVRNELQEKTLQLDLHCLIDRILSRLPQKWPAASKVE